MTDSARCGAPDDVLEVFPPAPAELGFVLGRLCIVFIILFLFLLCADPSRASFFVLPLSGRALLPRFTGSFFSSLVALSVFPIHSHLYRTYIVFLWFLFISNVSTSFSTSARKIYVVVCQGFLIGAPNEHHEFGLRIPIFGRERSGHFGKSYTLPTSLI
ncbi:hypothetical protein B0H13DRAFT_264807 [Mycena leptocephala]|nr:hypothetical protein B0H13DRAFT_264807 [Mycena leptocephala]